LDARHAQFELWRSAVAVLAVPLVALALLMPSVPLVVVSVVVGGVWTGLAAVVSGGPRVPAYVHLSRWLAAAAVAASIDGAHFLGGWATLLTVLLSVLGVVLWARQLGPDEVAPGSSAAMVDPATDPTRPWPRD
jgi:hypothetical protein